MASAKFICALIVVLALSGCAMPKVKMYDGKRLSANEEATVSVERGNRLGRLNIFQVDGTRPVSNFTLAFTKKPASDVYLLPGVHIVGIGIEKRHGLYLMSAGGCIEFTVEAGKTYIAKAKGDEVSVRFWVEPQGTQTPIGEAVECPRL